MSQRTSGIDGMEGDDKVVLGVYDNWKAAIFAAIIPLLAAYVLDTKWVLAISLSILIILIIDCKRMLHELCVRLHRINILLSNKNSK